MEEYMQKRIISFGVLGVGAALILFPILMNLYYMFTCEVELRNRNEFQAYYTTSSGGDANQLNRPQTSRFGESNPTGSIYGGRAYVSVSSTPDNYFDTSDSTFVHPSGTNYRQSSARGSEVYRPTTYSSNNDEREYDQAGLPTRIYRNIKYKLAFYKQLFGIWHIAMMCLGVFVMVIGLIVFRESILMQERMRSFCGVDNLIHTDVEQIANPIHTDVEQMANPIHNEVEQMATEVTLEKPQLETPEPTAEIYNENEILKRLERELKAEPEKPCITRKQWEDMVEEHDKKYAGVAVDLVVPKNLCQ
ncbi:hypothetical protein NEAUS03_0936 [Nematocida ausubeli]|nr:hypothetical protein NEAUS03_0936 [Nematocida ausubeli]